jgi:hypothetical protein
MSMVCTKFRTREVPTWSAVTLALVFFCLGSFFSLDPASLLVCMGNSEAIAGIVQEITGITYLYPFSEKSPSGRIRPSEAVLNLYMVSSLFFFGEKELLHWKME